MGKIEDSTRAIDDQGQGHDKIHGFLISSHWFSFLKVKEF